LISHREFANQTRGKRHHC